MSEVKLSNKKYKIVGTAIVAGAIAGACAPVIGVAALGCLGTTATVALVEVLGFAVAGAAVEGGLIAGVVNIFPPKIWNEIEKICFLSN